MTDLKTIIKELIASKSEGIYWDFKREWYENNASLLHDILCMSNAEHKGNRYIIIGITNNYKILGLKDDQSRKNQGNLISLLGSKSFANDSRPEIEVNTIQINRKQIDVIIIKDKPLKPYFLAKVYSNKNKKVDLYIYTRVGDTNTPINEQADQCQIEYMWKERFGLFLPPIERLSNLLIEPSEWSKDDYNCHYHKLFPEFKIVFGETKEGNLIDNPYSIYYPSEVIGYGSVKFLYKSTELLKRNFINCDNCQIRLPEPKKEIVNRNDIRECFYYYIKDSFEGRFLYYLKDSKFLYDYNDDEQDLISEMKIWPLLLFKTTDDFNNFIDFVNDEKNNDKMQNIKDNVHIDNKIKNRVINDERDKKQVYNVSIYREIYRFWLEQKTLV